MSTTEAITLDDTELVDSVFQRIATDLGMIIDRDIGVEKAATSREAQRPSGTGKVHISFKLGFQVEEQLAHGCVLMPLPDAIAIASYLMMAADEDVAQARERTELDRSMKDALLEVCNFVAGACDAIVRRALPRRATVRSEGCQGVRAGVRPAFPYAEGTELIVGRTQASVHEFPSFELVLMMPDLEAL